MKRHLATVPRYLTPGEVKAMLSTCNLETAAGVRDRAILLLLVRLGLRAGEVAMLELEDIRWRSGEIVVRGKGCVVDHMPLLHEVGEAVANYLHTARPKNSSRRVFLRLCAPIGELAGRATVSTVVRSAINRAGLNPPVRGSHLLRHTLGTHMIRAGTSMTEIAEVLRHRSLGTTELYAKVAFESLRAIAQPWPAAGEVR
jgi:site-specific recombinase XerD